MDRSEELRFRGLLHDALAGLERLGIHGGYGALAIVRGEVVDYKTPDVYTTRVGRTREVPLGNRGDESGHGDAEREWADGSDAERSSADRYDEP